MAEREGQIEGGGGGGGGNLATGARDQGQKPGRGN